MKDQHDIIAALAPVLVPILTPIIQPIIMAAIRAAMSEQSEKKPVIVEHPSDLPKTGFIRLPKVLSLIGVSRTTLLRRVKAGKFPPPLNLGGRMVAWRVEEVIRAIAALDDGRKTADSDAAGCFP